MRKHLAVLTALFVIMATPVLACDDAEDQAYLLDEILRLSYEGVPDRIIIKQMQTMEFVFCISGDDIIELRQLGVSDEVIESIIETSLEIEEQRGSDTVYVRVSPGYWSPWYRYPSAWGYYYDPFPLSYSYYYYPFLYQCGYRDWYGWSPDSYYYAYNTYNYNYYNSPHDGDYRNESPQRLAVQTGRGVEHVTSPRGVVPLMGTPLVNRPAPATAGAAGTPRLGGQVGDAITVAGNRQGAVEVVAPAQRRSATGRPRTLEDSRSPVLHVRDSATPVVVTPGTQQVQPRVQPRTTPRRLKDYRTPTQTVKRPSSRDATVQKRTPVRVRPAAKRTTTRVTTPPKRTTTRVTPPAKRTTTRVKSPPATSKRTQKRVSTPPKRTVRKTPSRTPTRVKAPARSAPPRRAPAQRSAPPKASRPKSR